MNKLKSIFIIFISFSLLSLAGCEALKKKFVRKHKGEQEKEEDVVFQPREYPSQEFTNDQLYENHYLLWKSWKDELSESLSEGVSHKRQIDNAKEMISNLESMKFFLTEENQSGLESLIQEAGKINSKVSRGNLNNTDFFTLKSSLETLERKVKKGYSYKKVKDFIKK